MKYGIWNTALPDSAAVDALQQAGYSPLTARVLAGRGCGTPQQAQELLCADAPLFDPFLLREMDRAVQTVRQALQLGQRIAVFGDYDVDGITATCLLTDFLRGMGADCVVHIPGRLEEGYGLNAGAIRQLHAQGVRLIITVDCGITALEEAELCRELGVTLVVTDHHECKEQLPQCAAVVDPHRPDRTYPHTMLSGVGIAFKLAAALSGDQDGVARRYCDLICLGTIADVMTLQGENRRLVVMGLKALRQPQRLGLRALIHACGCDEQEITAGTIGYILAPRVNAAGRMEQAELAVRLFLTQDPQEADRLAETLCRLNRERQTIESEIYSEAVSRLHGAPDGAEEIRVENLTVQDNRGLTAVDGLSLSVRAGEILGIAAIEGNGQSELLEAIAGMRPVEHGKIFVHEQDVTGKTPGEIRAAGLAHVPEDRLATGLSAEASVTENLLAGKQREPRFSGFAFCQRTSSIERYASELYEKFDIRGAGTGAKAGSMSGGNMQKVVIAREFSFDAPVLLIAQPTRGVDVGAIEFIHARILEKRNEGCAILLCSADLDEVFRLSDRIITMYEGRITGEFSAAEISREEIGYCMTGGRREEAQA